MTYSLIDNHIRHDSGRCKNVCTSAVLAHFSIFPGQYHYAENRDDVKRVLRNNGYSVRSRASMFGLRPGVTTIGKLRAAILKADGSVHSRYYVGVRGHAMVLNGRGATVCDTAPRKADRRAVMHVCLVQSKSGTDTRRICDLTDAEVAAWVRAKRLGMAA